MINWIRPLSIIAILLNSFNVLAQVPTCDPDVPYFYVNLTGQPAGSWTSPSHSRVDQCCSADNSDNCTSFEVILDANSAMMNLEIVSGNLPTGALFYQINCGTPIAVGQPICIVGTGPHYITFCKPGNNENGYKITSIAKPTFPADAYVRLGCTKALTTLGLSVGSVTWNSIPQWSQPAGFYNTLLSSTTANSPVYTPTAGLPAYIDYRVCGTPLASICGYVAVCDTVRIYNLAAMTATVTPTNAGFCAGGSVVLTGSASGGLAPYTYIWKNQSNVQVGTGATYTATAAGTYQLEVRDAIYDATTCPALLKSVPVVVTNPPVVNAGNDQTVCSATPTAYLSASMSNSPTGIWTGGAGTYSPNNTSQIMSYTPTPGEIASGTVTLTFTSTGAGGGCTNSSDAVRIFYPPILTNSLSSYTLSCNGGTTNLTPVVGGGVSPYGYSWSNGSAATTISVGSGNYCVTITDAMGCSATSCGNVTTPSNISVTMSSTNTSTDVASDGTATAAVTGGTSPYTYAWSPSGQTTSTATGLAYGVHSVVVSDANGCTKASSVVVNKPSCAAFNVTTGDVDVLCYGASTGSAFASVVGGTAPYTYSWNSSPVQTNAIAVGLSAGVYLVTVTESGAGCVDVASVVITEPTQLINTMNHTNTSAVGATDGSATANPSGGSGPYTYSWSTTPVRTTQSITGLGGGSYTVTVTDANGCSLVDSARVVEPPCNFIVLNVYTTNVLCNGSATGTATAQMLFGNPPYTYLWSVGGQTTSSITGLSAGNISVLVTDALNCSQFKNVTITQPSALSLGLVKTDVLCNTSNDGTLDLTVSGGTYPYSYLWSNSVTVEDQANLSDGAYAVVVTDAAGCTATTGTTINRPTAVSISSVKTNVSCKSGSNGSINATVTGGVPPYTYSWTNGATTEDISGLSAGGYTLTVTDANGCANPVAHSVFINEPDSVDVTQFVIACPVPGSGVANVDVYPTGGDGGPYTVSFNNGVSYLTAGDYSELLPVGTTYTVYVKDGNNCISSAQILTINPEPSITSVTYPICPPAGLGTATVTIVPAGGAGAPYTVSTNNGGSYDAPGDYVDTLAIANTYNIIVKDPLGCISEVTTIVIPDTLSATAVKSNYNGGYNISCFGLSNGNISLNPTGGTTPYTYLWNNGSMTATTQNLTNISAGSYTLTLQDANNCQKTLVVNMTQPAVLAATATVSTNYNGSSVSCNGSSNGAIDLTVTGGTPGFTYLWSGSQTTQDITGLTSGNYNVTVTDANSCQTTATVTLTQPAALSATVTPFTYAGGVNISCNGLSNGSIDLSVSGGTTNYTYQWSGGSTATTQDITGLSAGNYTVLITDANGCTTTRTVTLTQPSALTTTVTPLTYAGGVNISCNGLSNGSIDLTVAGGTTNYTYQWSGGSTATTQDITGLAAANYTVLVTDANGCTSSKTVTLTQPAVLSTTVTPFTYAGGNNISCNGLSNGSIDLTVTGGTTNYTYLWSNLATTQDVTGLSSGNYNVTVTDANGCTSTKTVTLTQPAALSATVTPFTYAGGVNISCNGLSNGSIDLSVSGGTTNYSYQWSGGSTATTQDITGLSAGNYTVLITDANGCTTTRTVTLTQPSALTTTVTPFTYAGGVNISCNGLSNGSIDLTVAGGTTNYTYQWSGGSTATTQDITGLAAANYTVLVTDANGCTSSKTVTLTQPAVLSTTVTPFTYAGGYNITCFGYTNGSIDLTVTGGTTNYTYSWSNLATTQDVSGLSSGNYNVTVTDANGCTSTKTVTLTQPAGMTSTVTPTVYAGGYNISCNGLSNGSIDLSLAGGTTPYTYQWSGGSTATTQDISGLSAGSYSVVITDANGCTISQSLTLTQPAVLTTTVTPFAYAGGYNISCNGLSNGSIDLTVAGGATNYTYQWSGGSTATTQDITPLAAANYTVLVTDANGCTSSKTVTLTQPAVLTSTVTPFVYAGGYNISCNGLSNGSIDLTVAGGTTNYTYSWSNLQTTQDISGLSAGNYGVQITDANGCTTTQTLTLTQPAILTSTVTPFTYAGGYNISCNGLSNGSIDLTVAGGTTNYTYQWSGGSTATTQDITGLSAASYSVLITDANSCTTSQTITLSEPAVLTSTVTPFTYAGGYNISCNGLSNGSIDLTVAGGTTNYTYQWSGGSTATTQDITGLSATSYSVLITDANGCTTSQTVTLTEPTLLTTTVTPFTYAGGYNISCNGLSNGSIDLSVSGGTTNYTYSWSNNINTQDVSGLSAGTYSVLVTDANGCTSTQTITLTQPNVLTTTLTPTVYAGGYNISCNGLSDGNIDLSVAGGTTAYTYSWSNAQTSEDITGLSAGTYSVLVTDANGCTTTAQIILTQPNVLTTTVVAATYNGQNISCNGLSDGAIDLTVAGGTTVYTYSWSNSQTSEDITGLAAGTYTVLVTDANGCTTTNTITLTQPNVLTSTVVATTYNGQNISCNGLSNGAIDLTVTGGTTAYTYSWSNAQTTQDISGLIAGTYTVLVTDVNGCTTTNTITLTQPAPLTSTVAVTSNYNGQNISCNGAADGAVDLSVSGGTTAYTYSWSNAQTTQDISGLTAGTYTVLITDVNGCTTTNTITLTQPAPLTTTVAVSNNFNGQNISCNGASDGAIDLTVAGGTTAYTYSWSTSATTQDISGLAANTYTVLVTDVNGCTATNTITLTQPAVLTTTIAVSTNYNGQNISCNGLTDGAIDLTVAGGTTAYTYSWSNSATTQDISGLGANSYTVLVTDVNGCTATNTITLTDPTPLTHTLTMSNVLCFGDSTGSASVSVSGSTPAYTYNWNNGQSTATATGLAIGMYVVTVSDVNGCSFTDSIQVGQPAVLADSMVVSDVLCNGGNTGSAMTNITGGLTPYTYQWNNLATTSSITGLTIGVYIVQVTDSNGCTIVDTAIVNEPAALADSIFVSNVLCHGDSSGFVNVTISGGMTPYTYLWSNNQTTANATGLTIGSYTLTVTDSNACVLTVPVTITQPPLMTSLLSPTHTSCNGVADGTALATIIGGVTPYTYQWSANASNQTTQLATGLAAGTYYVAVTDSNGCSLMDSVVINQNAQVAFAFAQTNVSCWGNANGTIDLSVFGGQTPYAYNWSTGDTTQDLTGLAPGTYIVTVLDSNNCMLTDSVVITEPDSLFASYVSYLYPNGHNITLSGASDGSVDLTVIGGTNPYSYFWSNGASTQDINGVPAGNYIVQVTDSNGCVYTINLTLTEPFVLQMPTGFSPNFDGFNDYFVIHGIESYPDNKLVVYNRWGNVVYSKDNYFNEWDGRSNSGDALPEATYFVVLTINSPEKITLTGYVDLRK